MMRWAKPLVLASIAPVLHGIGMPFGMEYECFVMPEGRREYLIPFPCTACCHNLSGDLHGFFRRSVAVGKVAESGYHKVSRADFFSDSPDVLAQPGNFLLPISVFHVEKGNKAFSHLKNL